MTDPILSISNLTKRFGGLHVTNDVCLDILPGEIHALIGPNGAGKSTLIHQISGLLTPDAGTIVFCGNDMTRDEPFRRAELGLARSFQITSIIPAFTVLENVSLATQARDSSSFRFFGDASLEAALIEPAMNALKDVDLTGRAHVIASELSHGEKRSLEVAMALALKPHMVLLDEPMAGTGPEETDRLIALLKRLKGRFPILLVEHDMEAVFALADRVSVLIYGRIVITGTPDEIRTHPEVIAAYLGDEVE
ncbi:ABC transporter ATP-binding protein (plasmid) [Agrobacterium tumefaciens]|uniref:ABC transporter ATP-binding protein n=1 Tax=Agrobacterium tumefaciens TaxID=358 RepID=A0AAJ4N8Z1_AGRTU|nr:ABC transporter ATP-binding protein [Agrobacterium tumefaciens]